VNNTGDVADDAPARAASPYAERLTPSWWVGLLAAGFAGSFGLILLRVGPVPAVVATAVVLGLTTIALVRTVALVAVRDATFVVGPATLPVRCVSGVETLDAAAMREARTVQLDARAYLCLRGWISGGVRVHLDDPDDDTPYWLVSSRHPRALADALDAARGHR
jgi:Protein of unknown function (DUF3093)